MAYSDPAKLGTQGYVSRLSQQERMTDETLEQQEAEIDRSTLRTQRENLGGPSEAQTGSPHPQTSLTFDALITILRKGRRTILLTTAATLIAAAVLAFLLPTTYTASASFVPPGSSGGSSAAALLAQFSAAGGLGQLGGKGQGDLYVGILKSRTIGRAMVARFNLKNVYEVKKESQAENVLEKNSLFEMGLKDSIVTIHVTDKSPERARDLANGYLEVLQQTSAVLALTESSQRRLFYEQRLAKERDDLANAEVALKQNQEKTGLISPAGQTAEEIQTLANLRAEITARQVRLASLRQDEADENPDILRIRNEISNLQGQVAQLESGQTRSQYGRFSTAQVPELQLEYIRKFRDVKYHEALFDIIAKQYEAARLDEARDSPLQVLDRAVVPDTKSGPHRSIILAVGLLWGIMLGIVRILYPIIRHSSSQ